jgi:hypothetical protein
MQVSEIAHRQKIIHIGYELRGPGNCGGRIADIKLMGPFLQVRREKEDLGAMVQPLERLDELQKHERIDIHCGADVT